MSTKKLLVFHRNIAPYRIDFFNDLYGAFDAHISFYYHNLKNQHFPEKELEKKLIFKPDYFETIIKIFGREIPVGFFKRIRIYKPDIVLVNEYSESYWVSLLYRCLTKKKYKIITICDDSESMVKSSNGLHAKARKLALKNIDGVILCNEYAQRVYQKLYPNVKTFVMPIIQDENKYFKDIDKIITRAKEIVTKESLVSRRVFLYVGRIAPEKNIIYLVRSFVINHEKNPENILYIIGDNTSKNKEYNNKVDELIKNNSAQDYIRKIGRRDGLDLKAWYYAGQVLMLPSVFEPFGAVTNEALLCGNYIMISSIAGSTCLVNDANGEIIDVKNKFIEFDRAISKVPCLSFDYIINKRNMMIFSYDNYINNLITWMKAC